MERVVLLYGLSLIEENCCPKAVERRAVDCERTVLFVVLYAGVL